jgi:RNA recognition motif-containing protein
MAAADNRHDFTNVYVKNFTINVSEEDLMAVFGEFGAIKSAVVMRDGQGMSKCFGFVDFHDHKAAAEAIVALDGKTNAIDGRQWYVGRAQKREERIKMLLSKFHRQDQLDTQQTMSRDDLEDDHRWSTHQHVSNDYFYSIINSDRANFSGDVSSIIFLEPKYIARCSHLIYRCNTAYACM